MFQNYYQDKEIAIDFSELKYLFEGIINGLKEPLLLSAQRRARKYPKPNYLKPSIPVLTHINWPYNQIISGNKVIYGNLQEDAPHHKENEAIM